MTEPFSPALHRYKRSAHRQIAGVSLDWDGSVAGEKTYTAISHDPAALEEVARTLIAEGWRADYKPIQDGSGCYKLEAWHRGESWTNP